jgi:hypothetical protein
MSEQDMDVNQEAETTATVEASTTEEQTVETPSAEAEQSADTIVQPESETKTIPYERFKEVNDRLKQMESYISAQNTAASQPQQPSYGNDGPFDPETTQALRETIRREREAEKEAEFVRKHRQDLEDPILAGTVQRLIADANAKGMYIDQEDALSRARQMIEERIKPQISQAKREGEIEGSDVARQKQQAAAVGDTSAKAPAKSDSELTAEEFAAKNGLKRMVE